MAQKLLFIQGCQFGVRSKNRCSLEINARSKPCRLNSFLIKLQIIIHKKIWSILIRVTEAVYRHLLLMQQIRCFRKLHC